MAGLYNVEVLPEARNQGIGRAISRAACQHARALNCRYVLLNAATHIYERLGFVSLSHGQTWWMFRPALDAPPPTPGTIAFIEAIGRGDTDALTALPANEVPSDLDAPLLCKMAPLEVAACLAQPDAAQWLLDRGASPDIIPLCELGWRERVPALLAAHPELANRRLGEQATTPLHEAVARNDIALARLLLSADPDLSLEDAQFHATALGWAHHFKREAFITLLSAH